MDKQYSIREVSAKFNLPASTLRYYEEVGILTDIPRNSSGKRIYLEKHINRLKTICCFKNTGMSIAQLQEFFQYEQQELSHIDDILKLNEDTTLEEKEAIIDETIIDIFLNKGDGYITVYSLNSAIDTDTIDDLYLNSGLYPEPSGDECINSSEIENIFINGGVVHEVFRC